LEIKRLLYEERMTIQGAKQRLRKVGIEYEQGTSRELLGLVKGELLGILETLK